MRQIGDRLVALGRLARRVAFGDPTNSRSARVLFSEGRGSACRVIQQSATATCIGRTIDATDT